MRNYIFWHSSTWASQSSVLPCPHWAWNTRTGSSSTSWPTLSPWRRSVSSAPATAPWLSQLKGTLSEKVGLLGYQNFINLITSDKSNHRCFYRSNSQSNVITGVPALVTLVGFSIVLLYHSTFPQNFVWVFKLIFLWKDRKKSILSACNVAAQTTIILYCASDEKNIFIFWGFLVLFIILIISNYIIIYGCHVFGDEFVFLKVTFSFNRKLKP